MSEKIDEMIRRAYRYFYDDGMVEMAIGLLFTAVGLLLLASRGAPSASLADGLLALGMVALVVGGTFLMKKIVQEMKEQITYPRTGYVSYRQGEPSLGRWPVLVAALAVALLALLLPEAMERMAVVEGLFLAIILSYLGYRSHVRRFYAVAAAALLLGALTWWLEAGDVVGSSVVFGGSGVVLFIAGALTFVTYLRQHPRSNDEDGS